MSPRAPKPESTPKRGGARPGAGRKPRADVGRTVTVCSVRLTPAEAETFWARVAESGYSGPDVVRAALRKDKWID